jgi:hypothetical protein
MWWRWLFLGTPTQWEKEHPVLGGIVYFLLWLVCALLVGVLLLRIDAVSMGAWLVVGVLVGVMRTVRLAGDKEVSNS